MLADRHVPACAGFPGDRGLSLPKGPCVVPTLQSASPLIPAVMTAVFSLRPAETRVTAAPGRERRAKTCGFSTFFSTVVENFGGRPYGGRRDGTLT